MMTTHKVMAVLPISFAACVDAVEPLPEQGLTIEAHTTSELRGAFVVGTQRLDFAVIEVAPSVYEFTELGDGFVINTRLDKSLGEGSYDFGDAALSDDQVTLVESLNSALGPAVAEDFELTMIEDLLLRQTSYVASAPRNRAMPAFAFSMNQSVEYLSCYCSYQYIGDLNGVQRYELAGQGWSCDYNWNGCQGRCGVGCGNDNNYLHINWSHWEYHRGSGVYSKDCAMHDVTNEWVDFTPAADDYFAGMNCKNKI